MQGLSSHVLHKKWYLNLLLPAIGQVGNLWANTSGLLGRAEYKTKIPSNRVFHIQDKKNMSWSAILYIFWQLYFLGERFNITNGLYTFFLGKNTWQPYFWTIWFCMLHIRHTMMVWTLWPTFPPSTLGWATHFEASAEASLMCAWLSMPARVPSTNPQSSRP